MTNASLSQPNKCAMCGVAQPCPEHGRTLVTQEDYRELRADVEGQMAVIDEWIFTDAWGRRWKCNPDGPGMIPAK